MLKAMMMLWTGSIMGQLSHKSEMDDGGMTSICKCSRGIRSIKDEVECYGELISLE